jgi:hypothetical protein
MKDLIQNIDLALENCIEGAKFYGLCHLLEDDSENPYPATVELQAEKAVPDDEYEITIYHRLLDSDFAPKDEFPFGRRTIKSNTQRIRTVVFIKIQVNDQGDGIEDIINSLPDKMVVSGYENVSLGSDISLIRDRAAIWEDEFGDAYKDKWQVVYHIYALEYDLFYTKCPVCV